MTTECARCAVLEGLVDRYAWERGDAQRRMIEAQEQRTEAQREVATFRSLAAAYKSDFDAELAGNAALRQKYGARENETMFDFHARLVQERDMLKALLSNLLARLHRDGGHYEAEHGTAKAVVDAEKNWVILRQVDEARAAEIKRLRSALHHISLDEYESSSSDTEKVHSHGRLARKALKGDEP